MESGWKNAVTVAEEFFVFPQSDYMAMETRSAKAEIKPDGQVIIYSTTQAPHSVKKS